MSRTLLSLFWLSIVLTSSCAFAGYFDHFKDPTPPERPRREAMVELAYKQLPEVIEFLASSREFTGQLTNEERKQLGLFRGLTYSIGAMRFYLSAPNGERTVKEFFGNVEVPTIQFSDDASMFQLANGQPARSAMSEPEMSKPILFNRTLLNDPRMNPSYLDILQLMIHEFGHKLDKAQNQTAMDSLGAKIISFLKPYYESKQISDAIKVEMLSLPISLRTSHSMISIRDVYVLSQWHGLVRYDTLSLNQLDNDNSQFLKAPSAMGNFSEKKMMRVKNLAAGSPPAPRHLSFELKFDVELESQAIFIDPHVNTLGWGFEFGNGQLMISQQQHAVLVKPSQRIFNMHTRIGIYTEPRSMAGPQETWVEGVESRPFPDFSLFTQVTSVVANSPTEISVQVSDASLVHSLQLHLSSNPGELLLEGTPTALAGTYLFQLPPGLKTSSGKVTASELVVNGQGAIPLPEVVQWPVEMAAENHFSYKDLSFFDGKDWRAYNAEGLQQAPGGPIRFRVVVENALRPLTQIRLRWLKAAALKLEDKSLVGHYSFIEEETVRQFELIREQSNDKQQVYEFISQDVLNMTLPQVMHKQVVAEDSGRRVLNQMIIADDQMNIKSGVYSSWMSIDDVNYMSIKKPGMTPALMCSDIVFAK